MGRSRSASPERPVAPSALRYLMNIPETHHIIKFLLNLRDWFSLRSTCRRLHAAERYRHREDYGWVRFEELVIYGPFRFGMLQRMIMAINLETGEQYYADKTVPVAELTSIGPIDLYLTGDPTTWARAEKLRIFGERGPCFALFEVTDEQIKSMSIFPWKTVTIEYPK